MAGKIEVTIQRENRLSAIRDLAEAIKLTARALQQAPTVIIKDTHIANADVGIKLDQSEDVEKTEIKEV